MERLIGRVWCRRYVLASALAVVAAGMVTVAAPAKSSSSSSSRSLPAAPPATADTCGYSGTVSTFSPGTPYSSYKFHESTMIKGATITGTGSSATINAFYSDEHALALGADANGYTTTPFGTALAAKNFGTPANPSSDDGLNGDGSAALGGSPLSVGDPSAIDPLHRPIYPAAFVTDVTSLSTTLAGNTASNATSIAVTSTAPFMVGDTITIDADSTTISAISGSTLTLAAKLATAHSSGATVAYSSGPAAGDWQALNSGSGGGTTGAGKPVFVAGTWKPFAAGDDDADDPGKGNGTNLGTEAEAFDTGINSGSESYSSEVRWNVDTLTANDGALMPGHRYRVQFLVHSGDEERTGGESGEACAILTVPQATPTLTTSASGPVETGGTITDTATLASAAGTPDKSLVTFNVYSKAAGCTTPLNTLGPIPTATTGTEAGSGNPTYTAAPFMPPAGTGTYVWIASFAGDTGNKSVSGACTDPGETSSVVDSYITVGPPEASNVVGATQTFTAQVFINSGNASEFVAPPDGTTVTFTLRSGSVGHFLSGNTCTTTGGSCTITTSSSTVGNDTMQASVTVTVPAVAGGATMTRTTGIAAPGHSNGPNAIKHWVAPPSSPQNPSISVTKSPKGQTISAGGTASFSIVVTNTGNVTLTDVNTSDALSPDCSKTSSSPGLGALASMAPGASISFNCSLAGATSSFVNSVIATGTPPSGPNVTATDTAPVAVTAPPTPPVVTPPVVTHHPAIAIAKTPRTQTLGIGGTARFTITVSNSGDVTLSNVTVADTLSPGCNHGLGALGVGQSKSYRCARTNVTAAFRNVAVATGEPPTSAAVKATGHANVKVAAFVPPQHPRIRIVEGPRHQTLTTRIVTTTTRTGATRTAVTYAAAHFTIRVTNTGDVALHSVRVIDPRSPSCSRNLKSFTRGKSKTYSCTSKTVSSNFTNIAIATGKSPNGRTVKARSLARVRVIVATNSV